jgi:hypothetical protein
MDQLSTIAWLFAVSGWLLDWLSTVWPNDQFREKNPFVVRYFGPQPRPLPFGIAKVASLVVIGGLYVFLRAVLRMETSVTASQYSGTIALMLPAVVGLLGWYATVHNLRLHIRTYQRE